MGLSHCVHVTDFSLKLFKLLVQNVKSVFRLLFSEISQNLLGIFVRTSCKVLDCKAAELPTHIVWSMAHSEILTYHLVRLVCEEGLEVLQLTENTNITIHHWNVVLEAGEYCFSAFQVYKYKHEYRLHKNKDLITQSMLNPLSNWFRVLTSKTAMMIRNKL